MSKDSNFLFLRNIIKLKSKIDNAQNKIPDLEPENITVEIIR